MCKYVSISVVVATYNGDKYIKNQISSIVSQLGCNDEIVVTDDGSTDSTLLLIEEFADPRILIIYSDNIKGPIGNFENGIKKASRDVIVLSDQDDVWLDGRLETFRAAFSAAKRRNLLVILDSVVVNEMLEVIYPSVFELLNSGPGLLKNITRNTYIGCHMAFFRTLVPIIVPFPKRIPMHDMWIGLVSELVGDVVFIKSATMLFRRTGRNFTQLKYSWKTRITWRLNIIKNLFIFCISNMRIIALKD
jgi:glycosyltransferase involved in cell wall biosynthesis